MTISINLILENTNPTQYEQAILTTDRAESSYGTPVLVIDGVAYGAGDIIPARFTGASKAAYAVQASVNFGQVASGEPLVKRFLDSCPVAQDNSPVASPEEQAAYNKSIDDMFASEE